MATAVEGDGRTAASSPHDPAQDLARDLARDRPSKRPASWPWWLLRIGVSIQAAATFLQPVFAGRFLAGDYGSLAAHRAGANIVLELSFAQLVTVLLAWRFGRAPASLILAVCAITVAVVIQVHAGFARNLGLHIPLGVLVVGVTGWLLAWVWRHNASRPGNTPGRAS